ncbi:MAG: adenylate/guanylate cyclase domain-containing protein [Candidatus Omnitrophica bacterium]|nr:adenylate/guanylate cyclase domain-containing protein [Candidatus Omnitrophota bacterium]
MNPKRDDNQKAFNIIRIAALALISVLLSFSLFQLNTFKSLEKRVYNSLFYFREPLDDEGKNVVIVAIDEDSIAQIGSWPWPRSRLAELIEKIKQGRPKVVGVDLLLDIPTKAKDGEEETEDRQLAQAFAREPVCVIPVVLEEDGRDVQKALFEPLDIFLTEYTRVGVINVSYNPEEKIVRDFKPVYNKIYLSFALALSLEYLGMGRDDIDIKDSFIELGEIRIPVYDARSLINYKRAKIDSFSASDVMDPSFRPAFFFEGKVVLVGRTDLASKDFIYTPVPSKEMFETLPMAGVELWKEVVDMILQQRFLYRPSLLAVFLIVFLLSLLISATTFHSNKKGAGVLIGALLFLTIAYYGLFLKWSFVLPFLYMAAACLITYVLAFIDNYTLFLREKNMITSAFKSYLSPHILQNILTQKEDLTTGGRRKKLTILFADIKGFSDFADMQEPEEVLGLLKSFFAETNKVIIDHNGIIDKLMGDGILAFFGDFTDNEEHALNAVRAAIEMQQRISQLRSRLNFDLIVRIGINTGYVTVGNIGSSEHLEYTVIGKNVNLAQRLEASCDPEKILISEFTYQMVKDRIDVTDEREISLKGFARLVKVFTVLGLK